MTDSLSYLLNFSIQSLSLSTDTQKQPRISLMNSNDTPPPFLAQTLSDQGGEEGTRCLGFFTCLFILPHR